MWKKRKQIAFFIASNFVIHPQILIFSVFKILIANKIFHVTVLLLVYFAINLWHIRNLSTNTEATCFS